MIVHDNIETASAISPKRASTIAEMRTLWNHALWRQDLAVDLREPFIESYVAPQWSLEERTGLQTALLH